MNPLIASPTAMPAPRDPTKHAAMLSLAEQLLAGREAHRARLEEKGEPIGDAVETSIRLVRALVEQWRWIVDPAAHALPEITSSGWWGAWPHELEADTANAAERARQRATGGDAGTIALAERCEVLAWYQHRDESRMARIVNMVDLDRSYAGRAVTLASAADRAAA